MLVAAASGELQGGPDQREAFARLGIHLGSSIHFGCHLTTVTQPPAPQSARRALKTPRVWGCEQLSKPAFMPNQRAVWSFPADPPTTPIQPFSETSAS